MKKTRYWIALICLSVAIQGEECVSDANCGWPNYCVPSTGYCQPTEENPGFCVDLADYTCAAIWDPVCGCDGNTYSNDCEANYQNYMGIDNWGECEESDPQIGDECINNNGEDGYLDCLLSCVSTWHWENWLGDGWCDYGWGPSFDCFEFGYDCGDCNEDWDGTDPLGFCAEENDYLIEFTIQNVDVENETFEILLTNYTDITGLQFDQVGFDIDEVLADFTGTWVISTNNPPPVIIWELFGEPLPFGEYIVYIGGEITADEICIENAIFSDSNGEQIDPEQVYIGPCISNLDCLVQGDYTGDNEINILDIVGIVNCVIYNLSCPCADLNNDGVVNVLDIAIIVNMILGGG